MGDSRGITAMSFKGNVAENWKLWRARFENYLVASEIIKKDKKTQCAQLLHYIGDEGFKVYTTFHLEDEEQGKLQPLITKFEEHFIGKENLAYERYKFFTYRQSEGQTTEDFVVELKKKASRCKLETLQDSLVVTMLTCGIRNETIRERLLQEQTMTSDKAIELSGIGISQSKKSCHRYGSVQRGVIE